MHIKKFKLILQILSCTLAGLTISSCGTSSGNNNNNDGGSSPTINSSELYISQTSTVPVNSYSGTIGQLYITNRGAQDVHNVSYKLGSVGVLNYQQLPANFSRSSIEDKEGFILDPSSCITIKAGATCTMKFMAPALSIKKLNDNSLVKAFYETKKGTLEANQVISYSYLDTSSVKGVGFANSGLHIIGKLGQSHYATGYLIGGGNNSLYNVKLNLSSSNIKVADGFNNDQEIASGQIVPVLFKIDMQNNITQQVTATPIYNIKSAVVKQTQTKTKAKSLKPAKLASSLSSGDNYSGTSFTATLGTPSDRANLIVGATSILNNPNLMTTTVNVTNTGNANTNSGLSISKYETPSSGSWSDITINSGTCGSNVLNANATNSCQFDITLANTSASGSGILAINDGTTPTVYSTIIWTNGKAYTNIAISNSTSSMNVPEGSASDSITFTISNTGTIPLTDIATSVINSEASATWQQTSSTCGATLTNSTCQISGTLNGVSSGSGTLNLKVTGTDGSSTARTYYGPNLSYTVAQLQHC